jgi:3-keto steroid reductase
MGSSFSVDDLQGLKTVAAYESSKRATDILFLGANLSSTQPYVQSYLTAPADITTAKTTQANDQDTPVKPRIFTCHPGICATSIMPLHPLLVYAQLFAFFLVRVLGNSPWLVTTADKGATAPVWLALETSTKLGEAQAAKKKWGSRVDRWGREGVMESEVDEIGDGLAGEVWARTELLRREWEGRCRAG